MRKLNNSKGVSIPKPILTLDILTLFPDVFSSYLNAGLIEKAIKKNLIAVRVHNIRNWAEDKYKTADDRPYGGGAGMVMKIGPIAGALEELKNKKSYTVMLSPRGNKLNQEKARDLAKKGHLILVCGHYEGVDQRVIDYYVDEELSIGDYVLSGGEPAAIVVTDTLTRLVPGFMGNRRSLEEESFTGKLLEFPQYSRPEEFKGLSVPDILLTGNHKEIAEWRKAKSLEITKKKRPDLLMALKG